MQDKAQISAILLILHFKPSPRRHRWNIEVGISVTGNAEISIANFRHVPDIAIVEDDVDIDFIVALELCVIKEYELRKCGAFARDLNVDGVGKRRQ
jgi:hypothetical protein